MCVSLPLSLSLFRWEVFIIFWGYLIQFGLWHYHVFLFYYFFAGYFYQLNCFGPYFCFAIILGFYTCRLLEPPHFYGGLRWFTRILIWARLSRLQNIVYCPDGFYFSVGVVWEGLLSLQFLKYSFVLQDPKFSFLFSMFQKVPLHSFWTSSPQKLLSFFFSFCK